MITQDQLKKKLIYCPDSGEFAWIKNPSGATAGSLNSSGYVIIGIDGERYRAHRLAWLYTHGVHPREFIDHIDRDRSNNRIRNLRECTNSQNQQNTKVINTNTSGFRGVSWMKSKSRWVAKINHNGERIHIGLFDSASDANQAYIRKENELKGSFARQETSI